MIDKRLSAYLDDELSDTETAEFETALESSDVLRSELTQIEQTRNLLRSMGEVEPSPGLFEPNVVSLKSYRRRRSASWLAPAAAIVGVAAVWLLVLGVFSGTSVARIVPAVDDYVDRHAAAIDVGESDGFTALEADDMPDEMPPMLDQVTGLAMMSAYERGETVHALYSDGEHDLSVYREPGKVDWEKVEANGRGTMAHDNDEISWHFETDSMSVLVVERGDEVVTVIADQGMDDMMAKAAEA